MLEKAAIAAAIVAALFPTYQYCGPTYFDTRPISFGWRHHPKRPTALW